MCLFSLPENGVKDFAVFVSHSETVSENDQASKLILAVIFKTMFTKSFICFDKPDQGVGIKDIFMGHPIPCP